MRNERPGRRKTSTMRTTSASEASADGGELATGRRAPDAARIGERVGQRLEHPLGDPLAAVRRRSPAYASSACSESACRSVPTAS